MPQTGVLVFGHSCSSSQGLTALVPAKKRPKPGTGISIQLGIEYNPFRAGKGTLSTPGKGPGTRVALLSGGSWVRE